MGTKFETNISSTQENVKYKNTISELQVAF